MPPDAEKLRHARRYGAYGAVPEAAAESGMVLIYLDG